MQNCKHNSSAPPSVILSLPDNQAGSARHKCAVCAYEKGVKDALNAVGRSLGSMDRNQIYKLLTTD